MDIGLSILIVGITIVIIYFLMRKPAPVVTPKASTAISLSELIAAGVAIAEIL